MNRAEIIKTINQLINGVFPIVSSTGLISRELYAHRDYPLNFYMVGSMGLASSICLGLAMNSRTKIIALEGDASLLMNLGSLANIGYYAPSNLVHIVLDNSAYASCSEESSITKTVNLSRLAKNAGYRQVYNIKTTHDLKQKLQQALKTPGPSFLLIKMDLLGRRDLPRPMDLSKVTRDFVKNFNPNQKYGKNRK